MPKKFIILFITFSFITKSIGGIENPNPILARLTISDVFGLLALIFGLQYLLKGLLYVNRITKMYIVSLFFFSILILLSPFSLSIESSLIESLIILFLILISLLIFYLFKDNLFETIFPLIINTSIIAALLGYYDLVASIYNLPRIFEARNEGEIISGFRNAGQAGAYFLVFLSLLIPLNYSDLKKNLTKKYQKRLLFSIIISIIFLFTTGKIAAYIGFSIGAALFLIQQRKFKALGFATIITSFLILGFMNLNKFAPALNDRLNRKIESRIIQNYEGTGTNTFFKNNFSAAIQSFSDSPLTGSGIGAFQVKYGKYEVHSTYLKMLGEGGLIITISYIILILVFLNIFKLKNRNENPFQNYLILMIPFVIGCLISWSYTYHLRKREFWIFIAVLIIIKYNSKIWDNEKNITT